MYFGICLEVAKITEFRMFYNPHFLRQAKFMKKLFSNRNFSGGKSRPLVLVGALALASTQLAGCFTVGQEFASNRVNEIKVGQTRKQDISEMFGTPWRTGLEDGRPTWTYGIYKYSLFGGDDTQDLLIRFDPQGLVRSYTFSSTRK